MSLLARFRQKPVVPGSPEEQINQLTARAEAAEKALKEREETASALLQEAEAEISALNKSVETFKAAANRKDAEIQAAVDKAVALKVSAAAASAGAPEKELPPADPQAGGGDQIARLRAELSKNPGPVRAREIIAEIKKLSAVA